MTPPGTNGFTQIWNALIVDHRLGATAFRVAAYLGSKTDDWTIRERNICETLSIGQRAYRTALRELHAAGYIARGRTEQDQRTGRFRTEPPKLVRSLIVADPGKRLCPTEDALSIVGDRHVGTDTSGLGVLTQHPILNTETQQEDSSGLGSRPDGRSRPGAGAGEDQNRSEGASAPERLHCAEPECRWYWTVDPAQSPAVPGRMVAAHARRHEERACG
jgi:hypothetical protein